MVVAIGSIIKRVGEVMYCAKAIITHKDYDEHEFLSDEKFETREEAQGWLNGKGGYDFIQALMVYMDINEYLNGYVIDRYEVHELESVTNA